MPSSPSLQSAIVILDDDDDDNDYDQEGIGQRALQEQGHGQERKGTSTSRASSLAEGSFSTHPASLTPFRPGSMPRAHSIPSSSPPRSLLSSSQTTSATTLASRALSLSMLQPTCEPDVIILEDEEKSDIKGKEHDQSTTISSSSLSFPSSSPTLPGNPAPRAPSLLPDPSSPIRLRDKGKRPMLEDSPGPRRKKMPRSSLITSEDSTQAPWSFHLEDDDEEEEKEEDEYGCTLPNLDTLLQSTQHPLPDSTVSPPRKRSSQPTPHRALSMGDRPSLGSSHIPPSKPLPSRPMPKRAYSLDSPTRPMRTASSSQLNVREIQRLNPPRGRPIPEGDQVAEDLVLLVHPEFLTSMALDRRPRRRHQASSIQSDSPSRSLSSPPSSSLSDASSEGSEDMIQMLASMGCQVRVEEEGGEEKEEGEEGGQGELSGLGWPCARWLRRPTCTYDSEQRLWIPLGAEERANTPLTPEPFLLLFLTLPQLERVVDTYHEPGAPTLPGSGGTRAPGGLASWIQRIQSYSRVKSCRPLLLLEGGVKYARKREKDLNDQYISAVQTGEPGGDTRTQLLSPEEVDTCILNLEEAGIAMVPMVDRADTLMWIKHWTRDLVSRPQRIQEAKESIELGVAGISSGQKGERNGGVGMAWSLMLQHIYGVSVNVAQAITSKYPSPASLYAAWAECGEKRAPGLLATLVILPQSGVGSGRRLGLSVSARIYTILTSTNPDDVSGGFGDGS